MAAAKSYLVPVDFSKGSEIALKHAMTIARENRGKLILVHVISTTALYSPEESYVSYIDILEKNAAAEFKKLIKRWRLKPQECRTIVLVAAETAEAIVRQAKKARAAMIIMGSHGRTGLQRFLLGSVAERTLRYAECPVLIVKK